MGADELPKEKKVSREKSQDLSLKEGSLAGLRVWWLCDRQMESLEEEKSSGIVGRTKKSQGRGLVTQIGKPW